MAGEPRNAASEWARRMIASLNDQESVERNGLENVTPDFVRYDRRHMTPQPPADAETWRASLFTFSEIAGSWPTQRITEILAVRGDRLVAYSVLMMLGELAVIP